MGKKNQNRAKGKGKAPAKAASPVRVEEAPEKRADALAAANCSVTGQLASQSQARDIKFVNFSLTAYGTNLIQDTTLELNHGRRYGLIGRNGSGKTTFLNMLGHRELPIPEHIDICLLREEAAPSNQTAMEVVVGVGKRTVARLEKEEERIMMEEGPDSPLLLDIYDRLDSLDPTTFEKRAGELLCGLGFDKVMLKKATKDMSGGWRMRVALACALFQQADLLLLDQPSNHLDLGACVWLERYLASYDKILVIVSHSQDFLNGVCTNIMHLTPQKTLEYYGGNYDSFVKTKQENETNQMKQYYKQQEEIKHIKEFIASCGTYANLVRQAKSRQKILDKMEAEGLIKPVEREHVVSLFFPSCGTLAPPVLAFQDVAFAYSGKMGDALYKNLNLSIDLDSRIVLVGPNGTGKSTLLKLMDGEINPTAGMIQRHGQLRTARYNQHSCDILDLDLTPIEFMRREFASMNLEVTEWRQRIGRFGITGKAQTSPMRNMSDGQKSMTVFCYLACKSPHLLELDEPTNNLDMECIDSLAEAINDFEGGVVLVSHDFRLLQKVAKEIWVCENKSIKRWEGTIMEYKDHLVKSLETV